MKKISLWVKNNWIPVAGIVFFSLLKLYVSWEVRNFISDDMKFCLVPWFNTIKERGGIPALSKQVGNYGLLYQFLISLMTYIPHNPVHLYKLLSILFDYILGSVCGLCVWNLSGRDKNAFTKAAACYCLVIISPIVQMNSAMWGQCDSIYTSFAVLSLFFLWKEKYLLSFVMEGTALAFKLQAIFLLPVFVIMFFKRKKIRLMHFAVLPAVLILSGLPAIIMDRSFKDVFKIYAGQVVTYKASFMNCFVMGGLFPADGQNYEVIAPVLLSTACAFLFLVFLYAVRSEKDFGGFDIISLAFITVYGCFLFLPAMHERYNYAAEVLGLIIAVMRPKTARLLILMMALTLITYNSYLFKCPIESYIPFVIVNIVIFLLYVDTLRGAKDRTKAI